MNSFGFEWSFSYIIDAQVYRELEDSNLHEMVYHSVSVHGPHHGVPVNAPYQPLGGISRKRLQAMKSSTTYCYDFPLVRNLKFSSLPPPSSPWYTLSPVISYSFLSTMQGSSRVPNLIFSYFQSFRQTYFFLTLLFSGFLNCPEAIMGIGSSGCQETLGQSTFESNRASICWSKRHMGNSACSNKSQAWYERCWHGSLVLGNVHPRVP